MIKIFLGGVYTEDSKAFHAGLLPNISRCLKANRHDAGVVIMEINDETISDRSHEREITGEPIRQNARDSDKAET